MNKFAKGVLVGMVLLYVISPVDLVPGPIDDAIVCLLSLAASKAGSMVKAKV